MTSARNRRSSQARYDVPVGIAREIGRIIVTWSFLENMLQRAAWGLAGVDEPTGRLAVREPRVSDRLALICDLAELRGVTLPPELVKTLRKSLTTNGLVRDLMAHGAWGHDPGEGWLVVRARGGYDRPVEHSKNRKVDPEALRADGAKLRRLREGVEQTAESVRQLCQIIWAALHPADDGSGKPKDTE